MKISKIEIQNFKSIQDLTICCNKGLNAFIGKNGTGKSAVFDAVRFVLGETYPSINSFNEDWYIKSKKKDCKISIQFTDGSKIDFDTTKDKRHLTFNENVMNDETRSKYKINYIGSDRSVKSIMPNSSWSLLGRYFYNDNFFTNQEKIDFEAKMNEANQILQNNTSYKEFIESINNFTGEQICRKIDAKPKLYDTRHFLKSLEFYTADDENHEMNIQWQGSGIQNSFIIACLRALAKHKNMDNSPIFIDEPELYLHPHAKKALYKTLEDLDKNGTQIFYITHSAEFLSYDKSEAIHRFYIENEEGTKCKTGAKVLGTGNNIDINNNKISYNEAFFADFIFLVEGHSDYIFLKHVIECKTAKSIELMNISIINSNRKSNIENLYKAYEKLGINMFALYDKDEKINDETNNKIEALGNAYGFEKDIEGYLGYKPSCKNTDVQEWIDKSSLEERNKKIDFIWEKILEKLPNLSHLLSSG